MPATSTLSAMTVPVPEADTTVPRSPPAHNTQQQTDGSCAIHYAQTSFTPLGQIALLCHQRPDSSKDPAEEQGIVSESTRVPCGPVMSVMTKKTGPSAVCSNGLPRQSQDANQGE